MAVEGLGAPDGKPQAQLTQPVRRGFGTHACLAPSSPPALGSEHSSPSVLRQDLGTIEFLVQMFYFSTPNGGGGAGPHNALVQSRPHVCLFRLLFLQVT